VTARGKGRILREEKKPGEYLYKSESGFQLDKNLHVDPVGDSQLRGSNSFPTRDKNSTSWSRVGPRVGTELTSSWATVKHPNGYSNWPDVFDGLEDLALPSSIQFYRQLGLPHTFTCLDLTQNLA
jgi:hypothetical protein